jgi:hypothetical protein
VDQSGNCMSQSLRIRGCRNLNEKKVPVLAPFFVIKPLFLNQSDNPGLFSQPYSNSD